MSAAEKRGKKDIAAAKLSQSLDRLRCPLCHAAFFVDAAGLRCAQNHRFDLSRTGYVNFAGSADAANYDKALFSSRRKLFEAGLFGPVVESVGALLAESGDAAQVLDAGCGEGSFLAGLSRRLPKTAFFGVDLARGGIALATDFGEHALFFVADLAKLPFADESLDYIINILSPASYAEFKRTLKPGGKIVKALPQPGHLKELRKALNPAASLEPGDEPSDALKLAESHLNIESQSRLCYSFAVVPELQADLFAMTPLAAHAKPPETHVAQVTVDIALVAGTLK